MFFSVIIQGIFRSIHTLFPNSHTVTHRLCFCSALLPFQILSGLEIIIPLHTLFAMFKLGVKHLQLIEPDLEDHSPREPSNLSRASPTGDIPPPLSPNKEDPVVVESYEIYKRETEIILPCYIMMLDLALKQVSCSAFL